jgi:hypothetical protein
MKIVKVKEEKICSLCLRPIKEGEECIEYFNRIHKIPSSIKPGYLIGNRFMLHFRHFECQYNKTGKRNSKNLDEYIALLKVQAEVCKDKTVS